MHRYIGILLVSVAVVACGDNQEGNRAPLASDLAVVTAEDSPLQFTVDATDPDGDALTVTTTAPAHGTLVVSGPTLAYTPDADYHGPDSVTVSISDGAAAVTVAVAITVTPVNDAPTATPDAVAGVEDAGATLTGAALVMNDTDVDADALTVTAVGAASSGTVTLAGDTITFTPPANFAGDATFEYTVSDGIATATGVVSVTIAGVDDAPTAVDDAISTSENAPAITMASALLLNDSDPDGQTLSVTAVSNATSGTVALAGGVVTFTPTASFAGTAGFDYTVSDGALTDVGHVVVDVTGVNDAPVATDDAVMTTEDEALTVTSSSLLGNDTDIDSGLLSLIAVSAASNGTVTLSGGTITFTPAAEFSGTAEFDYTVSDGALSDTGHVTVTVVAADDQPVASADSGFTSEDLGVFVDVLVNDTGLGDGGITISSTNGAHGTTTAGASSILYVPAPNYVGTDTFTYTVTDADGDTATATVTVTMSAVDDLPVAVNDTATTDEAVGVTINVLTNDTGLGDGGITISSTDGAHGTTVADAGSVRYVPQQGYAGSDTFTYTITDTDGDTATATVTVTVAAVDYQPVAVDDAGFTVQNLGIFVDVLVNDTGLGDGGITISSTNGAHGTTIAGGANVLYLPQQNYVGTDTFTYTIMDADGDTSTATVTVTMAP